MTSAEETGTCKIMPYQDQRQYLTCVRGKNLWQLTIFEKRKVFFAFAKKQCALHLPICSFPSFS